MNIPQEGTEPVAPEMEAQAPTSGMNMDQEEDDGVDDDEYAADIVANLEEHLNSLPDEQKAFLAEYGTAPEGATLIGIILGKEAYDYMSKYVDPNKKLTVTKSTDAPQQSPSPTPMNIGEAQPQAQAPQMAPQPQQAPAMGM